MSRVKAHEGRIKSGNILISVHAEDREENKCARDIFERAGAEDIATADEASANRDEKPSAKGAVSQ